MSAAVPAGQISDNLDSDAVKAILLGLLLVCGIGVVLVVRTVQKMSTRVVLIGLLVAAGAGLWLQREQLDDCADQCSCRVFGQDVHVSGSGAFCPNEEN